MHTLGDMGVLVTQLPTRGLFYGGRLVSSKLARSFGLHKGIETMASTGQSKICIFWQEFLIGHSIFKREKPFADEEQSC